MIHFPGMRYVLFSLLIVLRFSAFAEDDYYPLVIGQERTMLLVMMEPDGSATIGREITKIERTVEKGGHAYFLCHVWSEGFQDKIDFTYLARKDDSGVYIIDERSGFADERRELILPLKSGLSWNQVIGPRTFTTTITGLENVKVYGDKTVDNCYHFQNTVDDDSCIRSASYANGIGMVKNSLILKASRSLVYMLIEFKPGK